MSVNSSKKYRVLVSSERIKDGICKEVVVAASDICFAIPIAIKQVSYPGKLTVESINRL